MRRPWHHARRLIGALAVVALLLSVVGTAAHHHDAHEVAASGCAVCLAAHHAPAVMAPVGVMSAPVAHVRVLGTAPAWAVVVRHGRQAQGRAPPPPQPGLG